MQEGSLMISYPDAVAEILKNVHVLKSEEKPPAKCAGQVTACDIYSNLNLPQSATCGPDGYALRSADIPQARREHPAILQIIETVRAGVLSRRIVMAGTAARVMTGSALPRGADCVVRFEDTDEPVSKSGPNPNRPKQVKIFQSAAANANVFHAGSIVRRKALLIPKGTVIGPAQISALIATGKTKIKVIRRPVIAIIATGDELIAPGKPLPGGKAYNSNASALAAVIAQHGGIPKVLGIARDNPNSLQKKILQGLTADAILTSGGASKGDYDLVRMVLQKIGKIIFASIGMGPGKATAFGLVYRRMNGKQSAPVPLFALAGPPTGCLINFETLVRPALRKMQGHAILHHPEVEAQALDSYVVKTPFDFVLWTRLEITKAGYRVTLNTSPGAGFLSSMAAANSLALLPQGTHIHPGDRVRVLPLE
jgi:molybdopterin molybdotransferase